MSEQTSAVDWGKLTFAAITAVTVLVQSIRSPTAPTPMTPTPQVPQISPPAPDPLSESKLDSIQNTLNQLVIAVNRLSLRPVESSATFQGARQP